MSERVAIDWSSAEVRDATLTVAFAPAADKPWTARLAEVLERLERPGADWGAMKVTRKRVSVAGVQPGGEADLRHHLEGAVQQANADVADPLEPAKSGGPDAEMTAAFRRFADRDALTE